ncbi:MAG: phosphatidylglycerol lysyltransferase domain-containing protein [Thermoleophilia bacterium]
MGPRLYVLGRRVHECHAGLVLLALAFALHLAPHVPGGTVPVIAVLGAWMAVKDARDLVPRLRDTAAWGIGVHRSPSPLRPHPRGDMAPLALGLLVMAAGFVEAAYALHPGARPPLGGFAAPAVTGAARAASPALALLMLTAGAQLMRRRRGAWAIAVVLLTAMATVALLRHDTDGAVLAAATAAVLVWARDAFPAAPCPGGLRAAALRAPVLAALAFSGTLGAVLAAHAHTAPHLDRAGAAREAVRLMLLDPGAVRYLHPFAWVPLCAGLMVAAAVIGTLAPLVRPLAARQAADPPWSRADAERLVRRHGDDSLSFFKLRADVRYLFSPCRRAMLGYRVQGRVLVVSGDPVGPREALPSLVEELFTFADRHGLRVAVLGAGAAFADLARGAGLRAVYLGEEAVVATAGLSLEGRAVRKLRQAVNRVERAGITLTAHRAGALTPCEVAELEAISARWRRGAPERGFSMAMDRVAGRDGCESRVLVARDASGTARGFLHLVPCAGRPAMSLSLMRRDRDTPNGLTEFMIVRGLELLRDEGVEEVSLNFVTFGRFLIAPRTRLERAAGRTVRTLDRWFQLDRLLRFNERFSPSWRPRYLLVDGWLAAPGTALAVMRLEGQLPAVRLRPRPEAEPAPVAGPSAARA